KHLDEIIATGPTLCHTLLHFAAGNCETGNGDRLHDEAVIRFAAAAPNLVHVDLSGAPSLSDASLAALLEHCRELQYLCIVGNDNEDGCIKGPALDILRERPELGQKLDTICLVNQDTLQEEFKTALEKLSSARKNLAIQFGSFGMGRSANAWLGGILSYLTLAFDLQCLDR
ncbi:MAG: hypothetical protein Q9212_003438, partial [Teloschistes hypoglaucus]